MPSELIIFYGCIVFCVCVCVCVLQTIKPLPLNQLNSSTCVTNIHKLHKLSFWSYLNLLLKGKAFEKYPKVK